MFRIGFGFDTHRLEDNIPFWLGGIILDHVKGTIGHSDADVLIHAICDALLGAAGLPDIGAQFPDTSLEYKGIDSKILLKSTCELIKEKSYKIGNIDCTVVIEKPKIHSYIHDMIVTLSLVMGIEVSQLSIKAKTSEKLGFIGREDGVSAYAVVLLVTF
jgi:2-C-methyl-D-erythritol 2,4-cyclodiphosphate synthase